MEKYLTILKKSRLFAGFDEETLNLLLGRLPAEKRAFPKGTFIFHIGDQIPSMAVLLEGRVRIQKEDYWGNLSILNEIMPGEVFGESYAVPGSEPIVNNVVAVEDSIVLFLNFHQILTMCSLDCPFYGKLVENLLKVLSAKNRMLAQKLGHMSKRTTREKLLSYLSEQSVKAGSASFEIPFNRQQLSDFLSVDRSAMSTELGKMRDEGLLEFRKNHFTLKNSPHQSLSKSMRTVFPAGDGT